MVSYVLTAFLPKKNPHKKTGFRAQKIFCGSSNEKHVMKIRTQNVSSLMVPNCQTFETMRNNVIDETKHTNHA